MTLRELLFSGERASVHPPFQTADFITALIGLAVFAGVVTVSLRLARAQPEMRFAFPDPTKGATNQSFRLIVRPDIWGKQARIRLSNAFGTQPITFDAIHIGLQQSGSAILPGTNRPVTLAGKPASPSRPDNPPSATRSLCHS